jgi:HAMP domain-containing protein
MASNKGKPWTEEEVVRLLESLETTKSIQEIAAEHKRTTGGINGRRKALVYKYHFVDKLSLEEIQRKTRFSKDEIEMELEHRTAVVTAPMKPPVKSNTLTVSSDTTVKAKTTKADLSLELKAMREEIQELKKDVKQMLHYMTSLYEFETSD